MKRLNVGRICAASVLGLLIVSCSPLPDMKWRSQSQALQNTTDTRLGRAVAPLAKKHSDRSGIVALANGRDAFAVRALLANAAERSIDVQYYIWHPDLSGTLLLHALYRAAERGVRIRLLLDDNNTVGLDPLLTRLDAHPNIEVRLFNPFMQRKWRVLGYLTDFARLNRRMHNKSFTVDSQVTIIGGRNVGDEYFDAAQDVLFIDLDVMAIGPVVGDVAHDFDRYWASDSSYPIDRVVPPENPPPLSALAAETPNVERHQRTVSYTEALRHSPFVHDLLSGRLHFEWAHTQMLSDDPRKGLGLIDDAGLLWPKLRAALGPPERELLLVSPYFVPTAAGVDALTAIAKQGVEISIVTNSLAATDVAAVHAGYAKRRPALLESGIALFELKRTRSVSSSPGQSFAGSSASSLHAKTFAVDRKRVFIGSFNFDPRSSRLNTENGFVIESEALAQSIAAAIQQSTPSLAYKLRLQADGPLQWVEQDPSVVHDTEPDASRWRRAMVLVLSWLPIEWLL